MRIRHSDGELFQVPHHRTWPGRIESAGYLTAEHLGMA